VEIRRDGNVLIVVVNESQTVRFVVKPASTTAIGEYHVRAIVTSAGKTFDRSVLEDVKSFLQDQYGARGKYAAKIDTKVEEVAGNRVKINIDIVEGKRAKIRQINIVGNHTYKEKEILEAFELKTPNLLSSTSRTTVTRASRCRATWKAALLLHGSRLRQFRSRVHAGGHRAGEGRHLHHREHQRG
jgi:outer membrane protein assembly factor BamA